MSEMGCSVSGHMTSLSFFFLLLGKKRSLKTTVLQ